jgi:hypothetical protein
LLQQVSNLLTEKLSDEVRDVLVDVSVIDSERAFQWSKDDETRLNNLNMEVKHLRIPDSWTWAAAPGSARYDYNHQRMQYCVAEETKFVLVHCENCKATGLLVGLDQVESKVCYDCMNLSRETQKQKKMDAWNQVRPKCENYPTTVDGNGDIANLPELYPGIVIILIFIL